MTIYKDVFEIDFITHEKGQSIVKYFTSNNRIVKESVDIEEISFRTPVKSQGTKDIMRFTSEKPIACWLDPCDGDILTCDTMEKMIEDNWVEKEKKIIEKQNDE